MALFTIVFTTLAIVVLMKRFVDICFLPHLRHAASAVVVVFGLTLAFAAAGKSLKQQRPIILQYASGNISLKETFKTMESLGGAPPGTSISAVSEFRRAVNHGRLMSLAYDAGYSYYLPGEGILSEPTYALIRNPADILRKSPAQVANYLLDRDIRHFAINLRNRLFSTIAFTSLFDPQEMPKYFQVSYQRGDFFILSLRDGDQAAPLPHNLLLMLDLKRTGVLNYPFTERFAKRVTDGGKRIVRTTEDFRTVLHAFQQDIERIFTSEILSAVSLDRSRSLLRRILVAGQDTLDGLDSTDVLESRVIAGEVLIAERASEDDVRGRLLAAFRKAVHKQYASALGNELASLSLRCDERVPFASDYPRDAVCY